MSPVSTIYDHLTFNIHQQPINTNQIRIPNSRSNCENLHFLTKEKSLPMGEKEQTKRRYTITNISIPETIRYTSINNHVYDKPIIQKLSTRQNTPAYQQTNPNYYRIPSSTSNMDFRPLIINGRRKFGTIPSSSSMIIIKKKSPPPPPPQPSINHISYNQKPSIRSIPVDLLNNNMIIAAVSPMIPSSLSYSSSYSSSPSTSASSTNVGTVFLPIQVTKSQQNNNNKNNINTNIVNEGQQGYFYVQKHIDVPKSLAYRNQLKNDDDLDQSTRVPSASSIGDEGYNYKSTIVMDSNVLRLIRRYDPGSSNTVGIKPRPSLENTRGIWHTVSSKADTPQPSDSSPFLSRRSLTTTYEEDVPLKQSSTPRLQRQQAIHESDPPPPPPPPQLPTKSMRPILKYTSSRSRSEFIVQPHQTEPLTIEIDPIIPALPIESPATYQPLITTGTKRVCSALSKSEWDLRLQQDQIPIRPPSPSPLVINQQQQEKESYRPTFGRSKSSMTINHINDQDDHTGDFNNIPPLIIPSGSCVEKLKKLFVTKSSLDLTNPSLNNQHRNESIDSNLNRSINSNNEKDRSPSINKTTSIQSQPRMINKPTAIIQNVTPVFKKPIFRSQKTIDSPESISHPNNSIQMPSAEISYDAYRFHRLNDQNSNAIRPRNIAKVEPYSVNTNAIRPLNQSSSVSQPTTTAAVVPSLKARINLNSMGNTPINSSTSSSIGSHNGMIRHSDFLIPHPTYLKAPSQPPCNSSSSPSSYTTPPILFSESLVHGSLHQLPSDNIPSYNGHNNTGLSSLKHNSQDKYPSSLQTDFHSSMPISSSSNSYQYRPLQTNNQQQIDISGRSATIEQQQQQDNQQSRRRFQRRKQMKRSKSVDLYQDPSAFISPKTTTHDLNKPCRPQRSISREHLEGGENLSSSSSSSSLTADMERVNRAALLRYKSLDSITFNNQKPGINRRNTFNKNNNNNRRTMSKSIEHDFDSDDSVCGIPKPRKTIGR